MKYISNAEKWKPVRKKVVSPPNERPREENFVRTLMKKLSKMHEIGMIIEYKTMLTNIMLNLKLQISTNKKMKILKIKYLF